ncbi:hypothetical protein WR25_03318 [Diploscapter pachys]|uniref:Uncharacterized protein n=1 Tax=Diploscapter pachys TaxID=2018661 RepID=A0A2A2L3H1_9BILA|nr:hypothetical protein WR25_03318 [Diploscapter pachys]
MLDRDKETVPLPESDVMEDGRKDDTIIEMSETEFSYGKFNGKPQVSHISIVQSQSAQTTGMEEIMSRLMFIVSVVAVLGIVHGLDRLNQIVDIVTGAMALPAFISEYVIFIRESVKDPNFIDESPKLAKKLRAITTHQNKTHEKRKEEAKKLLEELIGENFKGNDKKIVDAKPGFKFTA